jgi:5-methylcytosine-specific restriction endonuclease McrA
MTTHELAVYEREGAAGLARIADRQLAARRARSGRVRVKSAPSREAKKEKRLSRKEHRAAVRAEVFARADGRCEVALLTEMRRCSGPAQEWDHFWSRRDPKDETIEATWALCFNCHRRKTDNDPSRTDWLGSFYFHAAQHGYEGQMVRAMNAIGHERAQHRRTAP